MMTPIIVTKFGGTSIGDSQSINRMIEIVCSQSTDKEVLVFSAMGKTTRQLLEMAKLSAAGHWKDAERNFDRLKEYHLSIGQACLPNFPETDSYTQLESYLKEIKEVLDGICRLKELPSRSQDRILSYGELMSTAILADCFKKNGITVKLMDARKLIITDDHFTHAHPILDVTEKRIREAILPIFKTECVPIVQGFIGSTRKGVTTTLGFEGSDLTTALIGSALNVQSIRVWKDVPGLMTADPSMVEGTKIVKQLSFNEAAELTLFGAKILHPSTIEPARKKGIPVQIYHSKRPDKMGTVISKGKRKNNHPVTSITYKRALKLLHISPDTFFPACDFLKAVFDLCDRERIKPLVITAADTRIVMAVESSANLSDLISDLEQFANIRLTEGKASVSVIGEYLSRSRHLVSHLLRELEMFTVDLIIHHASPINITFILDEKHIISAVNRLHGFFFNQ